jgi:cytochrome c biogenesis protein CcmG, thiol:disulfide interchange protein DsbE
VDTPPEGTPESRGWDRRRTIGAIVGGVIVLGIVVLLAVGLANKDIGTSIQDALVKGERPSAPDITLPVLTSGPGVGPEGSDVTLSRMRGKIVVLNFWASWCEPCRAEFPVLIQMRAAHPDVTVLGVVFQDTDGSARSFLQAHGATWPGVRDPSGDIASAYGVHAKPGIPVSILIGPDGVIRDRHVGPLQAGGAVTAFLASAPLR